MKKLALFGLCWGLALPFGRAELEIQDTPAPAPPSVSHQPGAGATNAAVPAVKPFVAPVPVTPGADADTLKFRNGDIFHGTVLAVAPPAGVRWRRTDVKDPISFDLENVAEIELAQRLKASSGPRVAADLTNGDRLEGELSSLDDKTLAFKTWYAGSLMIKRTMLERLSFLSDLPTTRYTGPNSLAEWVSDGNRGAWTYKKGALYGVGAGGISHDVKLPDVADLEFDLAWRGQLFANIGIGVDGDQRQIYNSGGYLFQFNFTSVFLQRVQANRGSANLGSNVDVPDLQRKSKVRVAIRINKPKKTIALFIDGNLVKQWTDSDEWCAHGTGVALMAQGQGQLRISNMTVSDWDGKIETDTGSTVKDADLVHLNNGDKVSGTVKSITGGQVALATSFAEVNVPLDRVGSIEFTSQKSERARRNANDVRAFFPSGDRMTFALEKLDEENLTGSTENCGHLTAMLAAFARVQFHIYEKLPDSSEDDDWGASSGGDGGGNNGFQGGNFFINQ